MKHRTVEPIPNHHNYPIIPINDSEVYMGYLWMCASGRIMCLAWEANGERLVTGSEDAVRIWSVATGHAIHKMTTGRAVTNRPTIVWCVSVTDDFTIITGDSRYFSHFKIMIHISYLFIWNIQHYSFNSVPTIEGAAE